MNQRKLSLKMRILIGIFAIPSLILAAMLLSSLINSPSIEVSFFEVVYSVVGVFGAYIALTGKKFF
jgi:hypothetical protein